MPFDKRSALGYSSAFLELWFSGNVTCPFFFFFFLWSEFFFNKLRNPQVCELKVYFGMKPDWQSVSNLSCINCSVGRQSWWLVSCEEQTLDFSS